MTTLILTIGLFALIAYYANEAAHYKRQAYRYRELLRRARERRHRRRVRPTVSDDTGIIPLGYIHHEE